MRLDKLTTKFQEALGEAQSLALANDHAYIEPEHLLRRHAAPGGRPARTAAARRRQRARPAGRGRGGHARSCRRCRARSRCRSAATWCRCCRPPRRKPLKRGDQFIASELFLLALADSKSDIGRIAREQRPDAQVARDGRRRRARRPERRQRRRRRPARSTQEVHHRPHRARPPGQARPGDRPRRGNPPRDPGAAAPHQEQPGADRRARRGQDRHRRGPGPAHRRRRRARDRSRTSACCRSTWPR